MYAETKLFPGTWKPCAPRQLGIGWLKKNDASGGKMRK